MVEYLAETYGKPTSLVLVGFEPRDFDRPRAARLSARFVVSHVGSLYPGNQKPELFVDGLDAFLQQHPEATACLDVRFVGLKCDETLAALVRRRPAERVVTIVPKVPSTEAVAMVSDSDVLLAFNCAPFAGQRGTLSYPSKVFEAMGARRPVLVMPPDGDWVDALLARTRGGTTAGAATEVAAVLGRWYDEWARTGTVAYHGIAAEIDAFTHERQAARLAAALDAAADPARTRQARRDGTPGALPTSNR